MRRSTRGMSAEQIDERLDGLGATLSIEAARSTASFHGGAIARSAGEYLELCTTILTEPQFDRAEFERIVEETRAQWVESLDNDSALVRRYFTRRFFSKHVYGRLPFGTPTSLDRIRLDDLEQLHEKLFAGDDLIIALSGDIDDSACEQFKDGLESRLTPSAAGATSSVTESPAGPTGRHLTFVDKPERTQTQIMIGCLGTHPHDADHIPLFVGHTIFGGTFGARLSREVRGKRGWSYGAYSDLPYDRARQAFTMWTFPQGADAAACIALELTLLENLVDRGVSKSELAAAKKYLQNSHAFSVDTAAKRASSALDRQIYGLPDDYHSNFVEKVRSVTLEQVNAALASRLSKNDLEITVVGTHDQIGDSVEKSIPNLAAVDVVAFDARD